MKQTFGMQAGLACIALAAAAFVAPGIANAQSAATTPAAPVTFPTFTSAQLSIETSTAGEAATGGLTCRWQEVELQKFQLIPYACDADVVGALQACVSRNKLVGAASQLIATKHPLGAEGGPVGFVSNSNGRINGTTTTAPGAEAEGAGGLQCTEPAQAQVVAVRWCNASLTDTTNNNLVGATTSELFQQFYSGLSATVPTCTQLLAPP